MSITTLFAQNHAIMLPVGKELSRPSINNIIVKPLATLVTHPNCPQTLKTLHTMSPLSNMIIASATQESWNVLFTALHDARTDSLTYDGHVLGHVRKMDSMCEDPNNAHILFSCGSDGNIFEWDLFTKKPLLITKVKEECNSIATNGHHIVVVTNQGRIILFNRHTRKQLTSDKEMHSNGELSYCTFHPLHRNFLFTADINGMINVFNLAGSADLCGELAKVKHGEPILVQNFDLSETYTATVQITDAADRFHFFGPNHKYIAITTPITQALELIEFDVHDETGETTVLHVNVRDRVNEGLLALLGCERELFYQEYTDNDADMNLLKNYAEVEQPDGSFVRVELVNFGADNTDGMGGEDDDEEGDGDAQSGDEEMGEAMDRGIDDIIDQNAQQTNQQQQSQVGGSAEVLFNSLNPQAAEEDDVALNKAAEQQHPRSWRATNIIGVQFSQDFYQAISNPAQAAACLNTTQLFIFLSTAGGGILCATVTPKMDTAEIVVTNIYPVLKPFVSHDVPLSQALCTIPPSADGSGILRPLIITGGKDGKMAVLNTVVRQEEIKLQNPAMFSKMVKDIESLGVKKTNAKKTQYKGATNPQQQQAGDMMAKPANKRYWKGPKK